MVNYRTRDNPNVHKSTLAEAPVATPDGGDDYGFFLDATDGEFKRALLDDMPGGGGGGGEPSDGDKGDIIVSSSGTVWNIDEGVVGTNELANSAVTTAKIADANVTAGKIADGNVTTDKIAASAVTLAKMADIDTDRLIGRDTAGTGVPEALTVGNGLTFTGSGGIGIANDGVTTARILDANVTTAKIANDAVTFAKMQNITTSRVLGRTTGGSGDVEELTVSAGLTMTAGTVGIQDAGVTTAKIADGNVTAAKLNADVLTALNAVYQPLDATLTGLAGLATGADKLAYSTGTNTFTQTDLTSTARSLLDDTSVAAMRTTLGVMHTIGKALYTERNTTTTLASDPELTFTMDASSFYTVRGCVMFETNDTADFKWGLTGPAASVLHVYRRSITPGGTVIDGIATDVSSYPTNIAINGTGGANGMVFFDLSIQVGGTGGTFAFQWAQNTSDGGSTYVLAGSTLEWKKNG